MVGQEMRRTVRIGVIGGGLKGCLNSGIVHGTNSHTHQILFTDRSDIFTYQYPVQPC